MFILWYKCIIFVSVCWYFIQLGVKLEYGVLVFWDCVYYIKVYICYDQFFLLSIIKEFLEVYQFVFVYIMRIFKVMRYVVQLEFDKIMIWQKYLCYISNILNLRDGGLLYFLIFRREMKKRCVVVYF